jgi:hypothetical protein
MYILGIVFDVPFVSGWWEDSLRTGTCSWAKAAWSSGLPLMISAHV